MLKFIVKLVKIFIYLKVFSNILLKLMKIFKNVFYINEH